MTQRLGVSERRACRVLGHPRSTERYAPRAAEDEQALTDAIVELARRFGRYGYRRITALLRMEGWDVNHKRVERLWRQAGLKVPGKQPKRGRLWLNDGSCVRPSAGVEEPRVGLRVHAAQDAGRQRGAPVDGHG